MILTATYDVLRASLVFIFAMPVAETSDLQAFGKADLYCCIFGWLPCICSLDNRPSACHLRLKFNIPQHEQFAEHKVLTTVMISKQALEVLCGMWRS